MSGRNLGLYTLQYEKGVFEDRWSWSPTKDDFDRLIDEQDCFEISLRQEQRKTQELRQEVRRLKQERRKLRDTISDRDKVIAESEERILAQKAEIEELKSKLDLNSNATVSESRKTLKTLKAVQSVAHRNGNGGEMNNNEASVPAKVILASPVQSPAPILTPVPIPVPVSALAPVPTPTSTPVSFSSPTLAPVPESDPPTPAPKGVEMRFKKAASLVAQLVQGFEAAAAANNSATNEMIRRRKTIHGCRTVTFSLQG